MTLARQGMSKAMKYHRLNTGYRIVHIAPPPTPRRERQAAYCVVRTPSTVFMHSVLGRRSALLTGAASDAEGRSAIQRT